MLSGQRKEMSLEAFRTEIPGEFRVISPQLMYGIYGVGEALVASWKTLTQIPSF